jgi:hypothetical protein
MSDLEAAYRATRYQVIDRDQSLTACIGSRSPALDALLAREGVTVGVFVTAWNPESRPTPEPENRRAAARLAAEVAALGLHALPHRGEGDDPGWPPEEGLFVLGLAEADAVALAERYRQNAVVVVERGEPARLVTTAWMDRAAGGVSTEDIAQ